MNVGTASSENNPTHSYFNSKGMWLFYTLLVVLLHWVVLSVPFISVALAWTLTNVLHNVVGVLVPFSCNLIDSLPMILWFNTVCDSIDLPRFLIPYGCINILAVALQRGHSP